MLILILIGVQYSQKAVFSFENSSDCPNHSSSGSLHPLKQIPLSKVSNTSLAPYHYLENFVVRESNKFLLKKSATETHSNRIVLNSKNIRNLKLSPVSLTMKVLLETLRGDGEWTGRRRLKKMVRRDCLTKLQ